MRMRKEHMRAKSLYVELYDYLEGFEQTEKIDIFEQIVKEWSEEQVEDFIMETFRRIPSDSFQKRSYYNFYANSTLAGAPFPCSAIECRMSNVADLLRFSALYADKMLLPSPIDKYVESIENGKRVNRMDLAGDVIIILMLKPLVLSGIIGFFSAYICLCEECLKKVITRENELQEKLLKISELMHKETSESISCNLSRDSNGIAYLAVRGAERLGFHEQIDILIYDENKKIKKLLKKSAEIKLTTKMMDDFGIIDYLFTPLIDDVFRAQINTSFLDSSYITNRPYDAMMISELQSMGMSEDAIEHARLIEKGLFHKVPLIGEVQIEDIVNLREKDGEVFEGYRSKMNSILNTYDKLDRKTILDIQKDIILPELDTMEQVIYRNKKALIKSAAQDILLMGGGIGIGVFSGMLPIDYSAVVGIVGGLSAISSVAEKARKCFSNDEIKSNNFYFLYELQKEYKKR